MAVCYYDWLSNGIENWCHHGDIWYVDNVGVNQETGHFFVQGELIRNVLEKNMGIPVLQYSSLWLSVAGHHEPLVCKAVVLWHMLI